MTRRLIMTVAAALALGLVCIAPASAGENFDSPGTSGEITTTTEGSTTTSVLGSTTSTGPTTSTTAEETTTSVAGEQVEQESSTTSVLAAQAQPLPRTGGDIGAEVVAGLALIGAGGALAIGARRRRTRTTS